MTVYGIDLLPDELRERCSSDAVGRAIVYLAGVVAAGGDVSVRLTAAIDDLIKARLDERQEAIATAILEAAP